jgi:hypothetical protein
MRSIIIVLSFLFISINIYAQTKGCDCGLTKGNKHPRQEIKDRSIPSSLNSVSNTTVKDIINWPVPDNPKLSGKQTDPKEESLYTVTGFARIIKIDPEDCDFQIEISGDKQNSGDRIIAEIPNTKEYCSLREKLIKDLKEKDNLSLKGKTTTIKNSVEVKLTGYAFWDSSFYTERAAAKEKRSGHGSKDVKTLWEIHPVVSIDVQ